MDDLKQDTIDRAEIEKQILDVFVTDGMVDRAKITPDATLESLEVQSVDVMMILMAIEEKFDVYIPIDGKIAESKNLNDFVQTLTDRIVEERTSRAT